LSFPARTVPPARPDPMPRILNALWLVLATATDRELARMVEYLKEENRVLRGKLPARITVTPQERQRLVKLGRPLGTKVKDLVTIVSPRTFSRWLARDTGPRTKTGTIRKPGRPRTPDDTRELVLRIAGETGWGYTRILGELRKLGVRNISRQTVVNILREAGLDPSPERRRGTWAEFCKRHAATLWACDFLGVKSVTATGVVDLYLLAFIHVGSRRAFVSGITAHPDAVWVTQQARNATMQFAEWNLPATLLLIDHDAKFVPGFDTVFAAEEAEVKRVGPRAPNLNAHVERFIQSLRVELLDHFIVGGERHLRFLVTEYLAHYNGERPHQGIGNVPLTSTGPDPPEPLPFPSAVVCHERLGGLIKSYARAA
jgi:putative transposase